MGLVLLDVGKATEETTSQKIASKEGYVRAAAVRDQKHVGWEGAPRAAMKESPKLEKIGKKDKKLGLGFQKDQWYVKSVLQFLESHLSARTTSNDR